MATQKTSTPKRILEDRLIARIVRESTYSEDGMVTFNLAYYFALRPIAQQRALTAILHKIHKGRSAAINRTKRDLKN